MTARWSELYGVYQRGRELLQLCCTAAPGQRAAQVAESLLALWPGSPLCLCWLNDEPARVINDQGIAQSNWVEPLCQAIRRRGDRLPARLRLPGRLGLSGMIDVVAVRSTAQPQGVLGMVFAEQIAPEPAAQVLQELAVDLSLRLRLCCCESLLEEMTATQTGWRGKFTLAEAIGPLMHELHNVLNGIALQTAILSRELPEDKQERIKVFRTLAFQASELLSPFDQYRHQLKQSSQRVQINMAIEAERAALASHGIALQTRLADALPEVHGHAEELGQLVWLLVVNAWRAQAVQGTTSAIVISTHSQEGKVLLVVEDAGPRLEEEELARLFELRGKGRPGEELMERVACQGLVRRLGGTLEAQARAGQGLVVRVAFPAIAGPELEKSNRRG